MDDEIQLISDGDGLAIIGDPTAVERFLKSRGLLSLSKDLGLHRLGSVLRAGAAVAQGGSEIAAKSVSWLKVTPESAQVIKDLGLMESATPGVSWAMAGKPGSIKSWIQIETGPGSLLTNPAILAGAAGIMEQLAGNMEQLARQHEMNEIKDYLARMDKKLEDVIRAQKNAELAKVIGAGFDIESAMTVLERQGRVDDDTWSTVQGRQQTITDALGWALLRFVDLAEKVESKTKIGDFAKTAKEAESEVRDLLAILARCFELQDALDVLRLDRVLDASPERLDAQRLALKDDRRKMRELVSQKIEHLMARMDAAAATANSNVLLHLPSHRAVVGSINHVAIAVDDFHRPLGIESGRDPLEAKRWWDAARDPRQLKNAGAEAGLKALRVVAGVGVVAGAAVLARRSGEEG
jgi:rRNA processing protein Krr1/Pno1